MFEMPNTSPATSSPLFELSSMYINEAPPLHIHCSAFLFVGGTFLPNLKHIAVWPLDSLLEYVPHSVGTLIVLMCTPIIFITHQIFPAATPLPFQFIFACYSALGGVFASFAMLIHFIRGIHNPYDVRNDTKFDRWREVLGGSDQNIRWWWWWWIVPVPSGFRYHKVAKLV
eukprot:c4197_g1_i2.p1 GENE.c4197_g1_i2~~c4197_g1_i2.p1  ORF type:complete len:171 (+),score=30.07 c4197_g1_i2:269-781(+)